MGGTSAFVFFVASIVFAGVSAITSLEEYDEAHKIFLVLTIIAGTLYIVLALLDEPSSKPKDTTGFE